LNRDIVLKKTLIKIANSNFSDKEEKYYNELIEEIESDKNFLELSGLVALRQYSHLKKVHEKLLDFIKKNKIKGMHTYPEAWHEFYQAGYGSNADFVHKLMEKEGITI
jgi:hypothetical protein